MKITKGLLVLFVLMSSLAVAEVLQFEMAAEKKPKYDDGNYWVYTYLGKTNSITVPDGKSLTIINFFFERFYSAQSGNAVNKINVRYGSSTNSINNYVWGSNYSSYQSPEGKSFIGPCFVELILEDSRMHWIQKSNSWDPAWDPEGAYALWRCELTDRQKDAVSSSLIPASSIVVPSNAVGDVDVLLEQSNDMITWTQCLPGTYNASTQKRFFRVRAVEK